MNLRVLPGGDPHRPELALLQLQNGLALGEGATPPAVAIGADLFDGGAANLQLVVELVDAVRQVVDRASAEGAAWPLGLVHVGFGPLGAYADVGAGVWKQAVPDILGSDKVARLVPGLCGQAAEVPSGAALHPHAQPLFQLWAHFKRHAVRDCCQQTAIEDGLKDQFHFDAELCVGGMDKTNACELLTYFKKVLLSYLLPVNACKSEPVFSTNHYACLHKSPKAKLFALIIHLFRKPG